MVAVGGVAVLVMVAFVAAVAMGGRSVPAAPGDRLAVARGGPTGVEVLVQRCPDERVTGVEVVDADGALVWRIGSRKGSIDARFAVGGDPPTGFVTDVALEGLPDGPLEARVALGVGDGDAMGFDASSLPAEGVRHRGVDLDEDDFRRRALGAVDCGGDEGGDRATVSWLFAGGAVVVALAYLGMVQRWWRGRPS
jgi:hypothetical protein